MCLRTFDPVTGEDLREIAWLSLQKMNRFTTRAGHPRGKYAPYLERLIGICLCQGAAQHHVDVQDSNGFDSEVFVSADEIREKGLRVLPTGQVVSGVKDVDVVFFFEHYAPISIPLVRHCRKSVYADLPKLRKRRIDFMKKTVPIEVIESVGGTRTLRRREGLHQAHASRTVSWGQVDSRPLSRKHHSCRNLANATANSGCRVRQRHVLQILW